MKIDLRFGTSIVLLTAISACAPMQQSEIKSPKGMDTTFSNPLTCTHKGETRTIERKESGAGCEVVYTKGGKSSVAGKSAKGSRHCDQVAGKIKKNLESAGWSCQ